MLNEQTIEDILLNSIRRAANYKELDASFDYTCGDERGTRKESEISYESELSFCLPIKYDETNVKLVIFVLASEEFHYPVNMREHDTYGEHTLYFTPYLTEIKKHESGVIQIEGFIESL